MSNSLQTIQRTLTALQDWEAQAAELERVAGSSCDTGLLDRANLDRVQQLLSLVEQERRMLDEGPEGTSGPDLPELAGARARLSDVAARLSWSWTMLHAVGASPAGADDRFSGRNR